MEAVLDPAMVRNSPFPSLDGKISFQNQESQSTSHVMETYNLQKKVERVCLLVFLPQEREPLSAWFI